jgi:hypothetical protein
MNSYDDKLIHRLADENRRLKAALAEAQRQLDKNALKWEETVNERDYAEARLAEGRKGGAA